MNILKSPDISYIDNKRNRFVIRFIRACENVIISEHCEIAKELLEKCLLRVSK